MRHAHQQNVNEVTHLGCEFSALDCGTRRGELQRRILGTVQENEWSYWPNRSISIFGGCGWDRGRPACW